MKRTTLFALAALALVPAARAQTVTETSAGQTLPAAQNASTSAVSQINGTIAPAADDADLYRLYITNFATFSATTVNNATGVDTALFLFDSSGHGIAANDDGSGTSLQSTLPVGNALYKNLPAGYYFLGISLSGNEPTNGPPPNQLIFTTSSTTTDVRGPASGLNPTTEGAFDGLYSFDETGPYRIDLTGVGGAPASAPEPSAFVALVVGALGLCALTIRAKRRAA